MSDQPPALARFVYHAVWTVEAPTQATPEATVRLLDPIGPGVMGKVIGMTAQRILDGKQASYVRVGAVSVTSEPDISTGGWMAQGEPQEPQEPGETGLAWPIPQGHEGTD